MAKNTALADTGRDLELDKQKSLPLAKTDKLHPIKPLTEQTLAASTINGSFTKNKCVTIRVARNNTDDFRYWRYISAYHGPWLQLPTHTLEAMSNKNLSAGPPYLVQPALMSDLVKIRVLVDEAADLAVRAQNGIAASELRSNNNNPGSSVGMYMPNRPLHGGLSRERKQRMREIATQKLCIAYQLDELAAGASVLQSAPALEVVASVVLQQNPSCNDAKYVQFFHEKVSTQETPNYNPLTRLNELVTSGTPHAAVYGTRAAAKVFGGDTMGAIQDLTLALNLFRQDKTNQNTSKSNLKAKQPKEAGHELGNNESVKPSGAHIFPDIDQDNGLELQLLFQRGYHCINWACAQVHEAIETIRDAEGLIAAETSAAKAETNQTTADSYSNDEIDDLLLRAMEARNLVRRYAKMALKDYTTFLAHFFHASEPFRRLASSQADVDAEVNEVSDRLADEHLRNESRNAGSKKRDADKSTALSQQSCSGSGRKTRQHLKVIPLTEVVSVSPPVDLPSRSVSDCSKDPSNPQEEQTIRYEVVSYHPLLQETVHMMLLAHALLQTPPKAMKRVAEGVARITALADGYPFFLPIKSQARIDWTEVLQKTNNWLDLGATWNTLCKPPDYYYKSVPSSKESVYSEAAEKNGLFSARESSSKAAQSWKKSASKTPATCTSKNNGKGDSTSQSSLDSDFKSTRMRVDLISDWILEASHMAFMDNHIPKKNKKAKKNASKANTGST